MDKVKIMARRPVHCLLSRGQLSLNRQPVGAGLLFAFGRRLSRPFGRQLNVLRTSKILSRRHPVHLSIQSVLGRRLVAPAMVDSLSHVRLIWSASLLEEVRLTTMSVKTHAWSIEATVAPVSSAICPIRAWNCLGRDMALAVCPDLKK